MFDEGRFDVATLAPQEEYDTLADLEEARDTRFWLLRRPRSREERLVGRPRLREKRTLRGNRKRVPAAARVDCLWTKPMVITLGEFDIECTNRH